MKNEQAEVGVVKAQAGHGAVERLQLDPGRCTDSPAVGCTRRQHIHEGRLAVKSIPGASQEVAVAILAVTQESLALFFRRGPVVPVHALVQARGQLLQATVLKEGGCPQGPGYKPGGFDGAEIVGAMDGVRGRVREVRHRAVVVRQALEHGQQAGANAEDSQAPSDQAIWGCRCQGQRDQAHAGRGRAAQALGARRPVVLLPVQDQAAGNLVIQEVLERLALQAKQEASIRRHQGRAIAMHGHAPGRAVCGLVIKTGEFRIGCRRPPWHGNAPSRSVE